MISRCNETPKLIARRGGIPTGQAPGLTTGDNTVQRKSFALRLITPFFVFQGYFQEVIHMQETITGIRLLECHVTKLDAITRETGFNRSEIIRRLVESAQIIPAQFTATIQQSEKRKGRKRERV